DDDVVEGARHQRHSRGRLVTPNTVANTFLARSSAQVAFGRPARLVIAALATKRSRPPLLISRHVVSMKGGQVYAGKGSEMPPRGRHRFTLTGRAGTAIGRKPVSLLVVLALLLATLITLTTRSFPASAASGTVTGTVYEDFDDNGVKDAGSVST